MERDFGHTCTNYDIILYTKSDFVFNCGVLHLGGLALLTLFPVRLSSILLRTLASCGVLVNLNAWSYSSLASYIGANDRVDVDNVFLYYS